MQKSRKIYETLVQDVAPGHIKSIIAYVAFERRMNNTEKAKDLLFKAFESSLAKGDGRAITYVSMQYARFCVFECNDIERACQIMQTARAKVKSSKVLYLSQINLLKHLHGLGLFQQPEVGGSAKAKKENKVIACFEQALFQSELSKREKADLANAYLEYLRETERSIHVIKQAEVRLRENNLMDLDSSEKEKELEHELASKGTLLGKRARNE